MALTNNHKMALLIMLKELLQKTDEDHTLNAAELIRILEKYGYNADRRTIYSNVEILSDFGITDITGSDKIEDLKSDMSELNDGSNQLVDGAQTGLRFIRRAVITEIGAPCARPADGQHSAAIAEFQIEIGKINMGGPPQVGIEPYVLRRQIPAVGGVLIFVIAQDAPKAGTVP